MAAELANGDEFDITIREIQRNGEPSLVDATPTAVVDIVAASDRYNIPGLPEISPDTTPKRIKINGNTYSVVGIDKTEQIIARPHKLETKGSTVEKKEKQSTIERFFAKHRLEAKIEKLESHPELLREQDKVVLARIKERIRTGAISSQALKVAAVETGLAAGATFPITIGEGALDAWIIIQLAHLGAEAAVIGGAIVGGFFLIGGLSGLTRVLWSFSKVQRIIKRNPDAYPKNTKSIARATALSTMFQLGWLWISMPALILGDPDAAYIAKLFKKNRKFLKDSKTKPNISQTHSDSSESFSSNFENRIKGYEGSDAILRGARELVSNGHADLQILEGDSILAVPKARAFQEAFDHWWGVEPWNEAYICLDHEEPRYDPVHKWSHKGIESLDRDGDDLICPDHADGRLHKLTQFWDFVATQQYLKTLTEHEGFKGLYVTWDEKLIGWILSYKTTIGDLFPSHEIFIDGVAISPDTLCDYVDTIGTMQVSGSSKVDHLNVLRTGRAYLDTLQSEAVNQKELGLLVTRTHNAAGNVTRIAKSFGFEDTGVISDVDKERGYWINSNGHSISIQPKIRPI